ncbi:hypothetical protein EDB85DRAFT_1993367 [Lactarius pseudohatsudake]|nr:hypothetical protein EDB85DRAFT_1993367 [Lactarius pseudohatsudake]
MCLPGDAPHLERLCSRAVDLPSLSWSSMKVGTWTWIQTLGTKTESSGRYRTSLMKTTISSAPRIARREPHLPGHLQRQVRERKRDKYVSAELQERRMPRRKRLRELGRITDAVVVVDPFTPKKKRCGKNAHKATRQAASSVSLETVAGQHSALRARSRERSNALAPADGAEHAQFGALGSARV